MDSSQPPSRRLRFDLPESVTSAGPSFTVSTERAAETPERDERLSSAIKRTRGHLLSIQHDEGYWLGELEGDTILESEYVLLMAFLQRETGKQSKRAANYILKQQLHDGGWAIYPGGPLEISASVKAYFALKLTGHSPDAEYMIRARQAILDAGGAEQVNSFTRYYLALLGVIDYEKCPAVPPELMLIPRWLPLNIYEMSAWSRTIVVPLSLLWAHRPQRTLPPEAGIRELFVHSPEQLSVSMGPADNRDGLNKTTRLNWGKLFRTLDRGLKLLERCHIRPFRPVAIRRAAQWILERFDNSDGLGAIFPPIVWSVVALKCLGYGDDSSEVQAALGELEKLMIHEDETVRLEPCKSPVWDTALATLALREAGVPAEHSAMQRAVDWLLSKEVRQPGDWATLNPDHEPSGWFFEHRNKFYPDTDDTSMVLMALCRCLPAKHSSFFKAEFLVGDWSPHEADNDTMAVVSGRVDSLREACEDIETTHRQLSAIWRGARWILAMQSCDGGWGAFDVNNNRDILTRVPFADHNAMIDPSSADLTARMLEMFGDLHVSGDRLESQRALDYVWREQESDGCWYGRWGVNYIYGTWQALVGLTAVGVSPKHERIQRAADWLKSKQQDCGGWGESPRSYDDPTLRGEGEPTASQTAWALMGLLAAGERDSDAARRGVAYLIDTQCEDGTWTEPWFTGTGFPKVFYLKYHLYRVYFPLMALARYDRLCRGS